MSTRTSGRHRGGGNSPGDAVVGVLTGASRDELIRQVAGAKGLPRDVVEDAVQDAVVSVLIRFDRPDAVAPDNPVAYAYRVVERAAVAIVRGRDLTVEDVEQLDGELVGSAAVDVPVEDVDQHDGDPLRRIAEEFAAESPGVPEWLLSAALSYITLMMYSDQVPSDLPWPQRGAARTHATAWPALFLAGLVELVGPDAGDAVRQRRRRRITAVISFLNRVFAEAAARGEVRGRG